VPVPPACPLAYPRLASTGPTGSWARSPSSAPTPPKPARRSWPPRRTSSLPRPWP